MICGDCGKELILKSLEGTHKGKWYVCEDNMVELINTAGKKNFVIYEYPNDCYWLKVTGIKEKRQCQV